MLVNPEGKLIGSVAEAFATRLPDPVEPSPVGAPPVRPQDYRPAPNRVVVLRQKVERTFKHGELELARHEDYADRDDRFNIYATVARVSWPAGMTPWFEKGDRVTISPSLFDEVELMPGKTVHVGPIGAVTGVFFDPETPGHAE